MTDKATPGQTEEFFRYIRDHVSDEQWAEIARIIDAALSDGVRLEFEDVIAVLESVVISSDDTVTAEDLLRLAG